MGSGVARRFIQVDYPPSGEWLTSNDDNNNDNNNLRAALVQVISWYWGLVRSPFQALHCTEHMGLTPKSYWVKQLVSLYKPIHQEFCAWSCVFKLLSSVIFIFSSRYILKAPFVVWSWLKVKISSGHAIALWKKHCGIDQKRLIM